MIIDDIPGNISLRTLTSMELVFFPNKERWIDHLADDTV